MDEYIRKSDAIEQALAQIHLLDITVRERILNFDGKAQAKTNADRIRSMTDEELAEWFAGHDAGLIANVLNNDYVEPTKDGWLEWLETGV